MEVVLLGTFAGPPPVPTRYGTSSAVVVDGAVYVVDCGRGSVSQYQRAGLAYADLAGVFITHLHADHIAEYYNLFLLGGTSVIGDQVPTGTPAYGPGPAGALPPAAGGAPVTTVNPADPTPGLAALTASSHAAFAYSSNTFQRLLPGVIRDPTTLVDPREIVVPDVGASATGDVAPAMEPFVVHEDDRVRVSAVLVPHGTVFPSFAFRFDSDHGSVVLSGDTRYSDNVVALARSADLLVHEAIGLTGSPLPPPVVDYQRTIHIEVDEVGVVAERASVPHLALSHIIDFAAPIEPIDVRGWRRRAQRGYSGRVTVGEDLMRLPVGRRARSVTG